MLPKRLDPHVGAWYNEHYGGTCMTVYQLVMEMK